MPNLPPPVARARRIQSDVWLTYWSAVEKGWGATCRLCLILTVRWGLPISVAVKLTSMLLGHGR